MVFWLFYTRLVVWLDAHSAVAPPVRSAGSVGSASNGGCVGVVLDSHASVLAGDRDSSDSSELGPTNHALLGLKAASAFRRSIDLSQRANEAARRIQRRPL